MKFRVQSIFNVKFYFNTEGVLLNFHRSSDDTLPKNKIKTNHMGPQILIFLFICYYMYTTENTVKINKITKEKKEAN